MKGFRFYAELPEGRHGKHATLAHLPFTVATLRNGAAKGLHCNCVAVFLGANGQPLVGSSGLFDALASVTTACDSPVTLTGVSYDFLHRECVRVPAWLALSLHPALSRAVGA